MFLNIPRDKRKLKGGNIGSCAQLVHYLEKENRIFKPEYPEQWFNGLGSGYAPYEIKNKIDQNRARLSDRDAKFFLVNISPSTKEIRHLKALYGEQGAKDQLKAFAIKVMDEYARNFNKQKLNGNEDLLWFAKLENHRYYTYDDKEVINGTAKRGEVKPGEQMHIQVIVSRKDITNKIKISPNTNHTGQNKKVSSKLGEFNSIAFKNSGERVFDKMFGFSRPLGDTFQYVNAQVNGTLAERMVMQEELLRTKQAGYVPKKDQSFEIGNPAQKDSATLLETLLAKPDFDPTPIVKRKKKRKKGAGQESGLSF